MRIRYIQAAYTSAAATFTGAWVRAGFGPGGIHVTASNFASGTVTIEYSYDITNADATTILQKDGATWNVTTNSSAFLPDLGNLFYRIKIAGASGTVTNLTVAVTQ
jgi:hypothetical protein